MIRIIEGKRYNTETAELIGEFESGNDRSNWRWFGEALYRTPKGAWFTVGSGGPLSPYSRRVGQNELTGAHDMFRVLTVTEVRGWVEAYCAAEVVERLFGAEIADA